MQIKFIVTKEERKALVKVIGEITGWATVYKGAPGFEFAVGNYIIDRHGTLIYDERTDEEDVRRLLAKLSAQGFICDWGTHSEPAAVSEPYQTNTVKDDVVFQSPIYDESGAENNCEEDSRYADWINTRVAGKVSIKVYIPLFNETVLNNLRKLIDGKASLIKKAIGTDDLSVAFFYGEVYFHWFNPESTKAEFNAYQQFVTALCLFAKNQKRVTMKESVSVDSEKFAFRCFLLRLGFIGGEYASARKILLEKLPGNSSFKNGDHKNRDTRKSAKTNGGIGCPFGLNSAVSAEASNETGFGFRANYNLTNSYLFKCVLIQPSICS